MKRNWMKRLVLGILTVALLTAGLAATAETGDAVSSATEGRMGAGRLIFSRNRQGFLGKRGGMEGGMGLWLGTASGLTGEQKEALQSAQSAYDAAVDSALDQLVAAGALTQEAVDGYRAQRSARRQFQSKDFSAWTLDQLSALRMALGRGRVNETILGGLVSDGVLTQEEMDLLKQAFSEPVDLWAQIGTSKATLGVMEALRSAEKAYQEALGDAGIAPSMGGQNGAPNGFGGQGNHGTGFGLRKGVQNANRP